MLDRALIAASILVFIISTRANAFPVEYSLIPKPGFFILRSCEDANGPRKSEVRLRLSSSRLEPARSVGLDIRVSLCVLFSGFVEKAYSFRSFPLVDVLSTPVDQMRRVSLASSDVTVLEQQTGERLRPLLEVEHSQAGKRETFALSLINESGNEVANLLLELGDQEARLLPGYDYQTQLPILAFSASYDGLALTSSTFSITTKGLLRKPIPARATPRTCSLWERFVSFFQGPNPNCI